MEQTSDHGDSCTGAQLFSETGGSTPNIYCFILDETTTATSMDGMARILTSKGRQTRRGNSRASSHKIATLKVNAIKACATGKNDSITQNLSVCNPISICLTLNDVLPRDSILVCDGGDFIGTAAYTVRPHGPLCWLDPGPFGTLGVGGT